MTMNQPDPCTSSPSDQDLAGRMLGDYLLLRRLGTGGMAEVYLAEQQSLQRQVAVKILRPELAAKENYVQRFQHEARAAAALVHANIVQIYEVGCVEGFHFIAQEYVRGQNVKQLVSRSGPLELPRIVSILRQMASALNKAGQEKIVHRDIKPENILLMPSGEVKVADFGLARVIDQRQTDLTQAGLTMGTPLYMSPEQVEGKSLDQRSDLYSCGVTAFYMLVGHPPFEGETPLSVAVQHLQNPPPSIGELRPDAPPELCDLVFKLLAKKPKDRYRNASELMLDLRNLPIEGAEFHVPVEDGMLADTQTEFSSGLEATRQLQKLMDTQAMLRMPSSKRWVVGLLIATAFLVGCGLARATWTGSILSWDEAASARIEKRSTAEQQYLDAVLRKQPSAEAWKAVAEYHDPNANADNRRWALRAQQQLAMFYLDRDDLDAAYDAFAELVNEIDKEFRAIGLAGQAIIHDFRDETDELRAKLPEAWAERDRLGDSLRADLENILAKRGIELPRERVERRPRRGGGP